MIEIKIGEYFIAVPFMAVYRNGMYMRSLNTGEMPYRGSWNLVSMLDGFAVDGEGGGPYLYRELEEARQDGEELEAAGEHSTCGGVVTIPGREKVEQITSDELVERIGKALGEMDGQDLAHFYNQHFGDGMEYCGDGVFKQTTRPVAEQELKS